MKTETFDYYLPKEKIAQTPIEPRHDSKLLIYDRRTEKISQSIFWNLDGLLKPGDLLVINQTKVLPARIYGNKMSGGKVEVLLLKKMDEDTWEALVGGKNLTSGKKIQFSDNLYCEIIEALDRSKRVIRFSSPVEDYLRESGQMPLPPYIHKKLENQDRYQTVYAQEEGSAAAPTAGLHFTQLLIDKLKSNGVNFAEITLHVGLDTFAPVTEANIEEHVIHTEWCQMDAHTAALINQTKNNSKRVVAVGTTSVRTLETAYRFHDQNGDLSVFSGPTDLFITPGYEFKIVDAMITNFHLPKSTLLMLVSAFAGLDNIKHCYKYALDNQFRFYSFGDAMFIQ